MQEQKKVVVLKGGMNAEREVSFSTAAGVINSLYELNYDVHSFDLKDNILELVQTLTTLQPDVVFNALHGTAAEDGCVQGLLNLMKIPYTHSGLLASAAAMHKPFAKRVFAQNGVQSPLGFVVSCTSLLTHEPLPRPFVIKPLNSGSSDGVYIIEATTDLTVIINQWRHGSTLLLEEYIPGAEIHVAVVDGIAHGAIEIRPLGGFYDYTAKYVEGHAEHIMPATLPSTDYQQALSIAEQAYAALECRSVARVDLRYNPEKSEGSRFYVLEINTQPGMTPLSLVPEIVAHQGITYTALVKTLVDKALYD